MRGDELFMAKSNIMHMGTNCNTSRHKIGLSEFINYQQIGQIIISQVYLTFFSNTNAGKEKARPTQVAKEGIGVPVTKSKNPLSPVHQDDAYGNEIVYRTMSLDNVKNS